MKFVQLTQTSGKQVWINPNHVQCVQMDDAKAVAKVVMISGYYYYVKESVEEIIGRCEANANH